MLWVNPSVSLAKAQQTGARGYEIFCLVWGKWRLRKRKRRKKKPACDIRRYVELCLSVRGTSDYQLLCLLGERDVVP